MDADKVLHGYENSRLIRYDNPKELADEMVSYDELCEYTGSGVLKYNMRHDDGKLYQIYSKQGNHVGVIAATRLGKTTSYVIPTILSFAHQKKKKSMIVSDPKGEIYRHTAYDLQKQGYDIKIINLRNAQRSEFWNPLTPIFRKYQAVFDVYREVELVETKKGKRNRFRGKTYQNQEDLDDAIERIKSMAMDEVAAEIESFSSMVIDVKDKHQPYWEDSARSILQAFLWAMLEDSREETRNQKWNPITEDLFSFNTIFTVFNTFQSSKDSFNDKGYFTERPIASKAYTLAKDNLIDNAGTTRMCITSTFATKMAPFRESAVRTITSCNSFEIFSLIEKPTILFINYKDEVQAHYHIISLFVQDAYSKLITAATERLSGELEIPFYFVLDEFGNFPCIENFKHNISISAGRAIFFILILQSFAQLDEVYGEKTAAIIRDNLNVQIMLGSNNPSTLEEFSRGCGEYTRISPLSALNGTGTDIEQYQTETIRLIPKSMLAHFEPGECAVTEANSGYVLWSKLERYYLCPEFSDAPLVDEQKYTSKFDPFNKRYYYTIPEKILKKKEYVFDFL